MLLKKEKLNQIKWGVILWILILIFMTDTSYLTINRSSFVSEIADIVIIIITIVCILKYLNITRMVLLLSISILITTMLTNSVFRLTYYTFIFSIWLCYYFVKNYTIEDFADYYLIIMKIVAVGSLICWFFPQFFVNLSFFPQFTSSAGATYRFLGVSTIPFATHMQRRNFGPFWEPGTFQVYLCVAIFLLLFVSRKKKKTLDLLLLIAVEMTTMSGASLIPAGLIVAAYLLKERNIKSFFGVLAGCILILILTDTGLFDSIFLKMTGEDSNSSFMFRWIGFEGGIRNFLSHPLFGASFGEAQQLRNELGLRYLGIPYGSNTNTFANYFGSYGLFVGIFFLTATYRFFKKTCNASIFVYIIVFTGYFLSTSNENLTGSLLIIVIAMLGWYGTHDNVCAEKYNVHC